MEVAKKDNDEFLIAHLQDIISGLHKTAEGTSEPHNYHELSEDAEELVKLFYSLSRKGRKRILEQVRDFCKIPEYQDRE